MDADDAEVLSARSPCERGVPGPCDGDDDEGDDPLAPGTGHPFVVLRPSVIDAVVGAGEAEPPPRERSSCSRFHREPVSCASAVDGALTPGSGGGGGGELLPPAGLKADDAARR